MSRKSKRNEQPQPAAAPAAPARGGVSRTAIFATAVVALLAAFAVGAVAYRSHQSEAARQVAAKSASLLASTHAPLLGKAEAKVHIVEFLDPACETCAEFYPLVKQLMAANPGRVRVVLRWAPFHPGSQDVVAMIEAARKQDKFWPALEALLASQGAWSVNHTAQSATAWQQLASLGLNREQMFADMASADVAQRITQDIEDARALNVTMTPEFFVNGKPMPSFGYEQLKQLVDEALAQAKR